MVSERDFIKSGRIVRKESGYRFVRNRGEIIVLDRAPDIEKKRSAWLQDTLCLAHRLELVGHKHQAELADHGIERPGLEREFARIRLFPIHGLARFEFSARKLHHRL